MLDLAAAQKIIAATLAYAMEQKFKPIAVGVIDARGALVAFALHTGAITG